MWFDKKTKSQQSELDLSKKINMKESTQQTGKQIHVSFAKGC